MEELELPHRRPDGIVHEKHATVVMSILVDQNTRLIVQGITGTAGKFHAEQCLKYGRRSSAASRRAAAGSH